MTRTIEMVGKKYGKLTVVQKSEKDHRGLRYDCTCDCGGKAEHVAGADLRNGRKTSCGCRYSERRKTHGMSGTRPFYIWGNMKKRCTNPNGQDYPRYGGRGIAYCDEWESFEGFWGDMEDGYRDDLTLDRIDVNGNYCKENCRWATIEEQQNNRRNNHILKFRGKELTLSQLAAITKQRPGVILQRLDRGLTPEEAIHRIIPLEEITFNGETKSVVKFAKEIGMTYHQLKKRLMRGWTVERALNQPLRKRSKTKAG